MDLSTRLYRITGPQSIDRIDPLVAKFGKEHGISFEIAAFPLAGMNPDLDSASGETSPERAIGQIDFVWETTCEKTWKQAHKNACVHNKLHNTVILEDKANLAFLQSKMDCPTLTTFVAHSMEDVSEWAATHFQKTTLLKEESGVEIAEFSESIQDDDIWVIKASRGNGGKDIWFIHKHNWEDILSELPKGDIFVIQRFCHMTILVRISILR